MRAAVTLSQSPLHLRPVARSCSLIEYSGDRASIQSNNDLQASAHFDFDEPRHAPYWHSQQAKLPCSSVLIASDKYI